MALTLNRKLSFIALLILTLTVTGCTSKKEGKVLASFSGGTITESEFKDKMQNLSREARRLAEKKKKEYLQELVDEDFLLREAKRRGIDREQEVRDLLGEAERRILVAKLIELEVDKKVKLGPDEAQKFYDANKQLFTTPLLLRASHILVATDAEAQSIRQKLLSGADFEQLARTMSLDQSAIRGGDVGFFQKGQVLPEFEDVAFKMKKGEISQPFKSQYGYHVMKLTDRAEPTLRDFKLVKGIVERQLIARKRIAIYREYLKSVKGNAKITIDDKALEAISFSEKPKVAQGV